MKKGMILLFAMFVFINLFSKDYVAIKGGVNVANIWGEDVPGELKNSTGFNAGICFVNSLKSGNEFQLEIIYSQKGTSVSLDSGLDISETYNYLEIPVLLKSRFGNPKSKMSLYAGPAFAILLSASQKQSYEYQSVSRAITSDLKQFDLSLNAGLDLHFSDTLFADVRYSMSIVNVYDLDIIAKNRVISLSLGYKIQ